MTWGIEHIVCGDSTIGKCGKTLRDGVLYACGGLTGGPESFWPIEPSSLKLTPYSFLAMTKQRNTGTGVQEEEAAKSHKLLRQLLK